MLKIKAVVKQFFAIVVLLAGSLSAMSGQSSDPLKVIIYSEYPPYLHRENGQHTGLYLRIADLTLTAINQPYELEVQPFKRAIHQAAAGNGIVVGILKTQEREQTLDFSEPFYQERISVFLHYRREELIRSVEQLEGLTIGTLLGWSYGDAFDAARANNLFRARNGELRPNFLMLTRDRLDAVVHSELSSIYLINKMGLKDKVFLGSEPLAMGDIHFAVKKGSHKEVLERLNNKLREKTHRQRITTLIEDYKN